MTQQTKKPLVEWQCQNCGAKLHYEKGGIRPQCPSCSTRGRMEKRRKYY